MEGRNTQRLSFTIGVVLWGMLYNLWNIFSDTGKFIMADKNCQRWTIFWGSLICPLHENGVMRLCPVFYCYFDLICPLAFMMNPDHWVSGSSHREQTRLWVSLSTWILFLGFNSRYDYMLLIQVGSQGYHN